MAQVARAVSLVLTVVTVVLVETVAQHQQTSERAQPLAVEEETADLRALVTAASLVLVVLRQLFHQHRPQLLAAVEETVVSPTQEPLQPVVLADRLRRHRQLARPQPAVAAETVVAAQ